MHQIVEFLNREKDEFREKVRTYIRDEKLRFFQTGDEEIEVENETIEVLEMQPHVEDNEKEQSRTGDRLKDIDSLLCDDSLLVSDDGNFSSSNYLHLVIKSGKVKVVNSLGEVMHEPGSKGNLVEEGDDQLFVEIACKVFDVNKVHFAL